jgi:hypothetical protein
MNLAGKEFAVAPVVKIDDETLVDLKSIAIWLETKTPSETIAYIVRETLGRLGLESEGIQTLVTSEDDGELHEYDAAPPLAHTKPTCVVINNTPIESSHWSSVLSLMVAQLKAKGLHGVDLVDALRVPALPEKYEEDRFNYDPDLGISIQRQRAPDVWREIDRIATVWSIPVTVEFAWSLSPHAKYPGRRGILRSGVR